MLQVGAEVPLEQVSWPVRLANLCKLLLLSMMICPGPKFPTRSPVKDAVPDAEAVPLEHVADVGGPVKLEPGLVNDIDNTLLGLRAAPDTTPLNVTVTFINDARAASR